MIYKKTINLFSKTGLGRSGHVRFQTVGPIWHASNPKMVFWQNDIMILHHVCRKSSKIKLFWPKTLIFNQKFRKILKNRLKYEFFLGSSLVCTAVWMLVTPLTRIPMIMLLRIWCLRIAKHGRLAALRLARETHRSST